jgi:hypothetical protein
MARDRGLATSGGGSTFTTGSDEAVANGWDGTSCPTAVQRMAIGRLDGQAFDGSVEALPDRDGQCCYHISPDCPGGRPFLVDGQTRVAVLSKSAGTETALGDPTASALAREWLGDALVEHASIAAFARLSLQLLAHGAPAELVQGAQLASLDELRHAAYCFERASYFAGKRLAPGPLDVQGALDDLSLAGLIESNLREGCIGETLAARRLEQKAAQTDDAHERRALLAICEDELRHAELAFRILAWCRQMAPQLTSEMIARVLDEAEPAGDQRAWRRVLKPLLGHLAA